MSILSRFFAWLRAVSEPLPPDPETFLPRDWADLPVHRPPCS